MSSIASLLKLPMPWHPSVATSANRLCSNAWVRVPVAG